MGVVPYVRLRLRLGKNAHSLGGPSAPAKEPSTIRTPPPPGVMPRLLPIVAPAPAPAPVARSGYATEV
ncbi:hypothetical protein [Streptomyces tauricus]|uniref:hypothetical protein n=1 Tax=Streptomyces tauricus TaxID=68274 RepID=UPI00341302AF